MQAEGFALPAAAVSADLVLVRVRGRRLAKTVTCSRGKFTAGWWCAALLIPIAWFYFWTAVPEWRPGLIGTSNDSYYNLLTRGFVKGHLSLDLAADPFLATLRNPSDPLERAGHGLHDASYYHGRYYIYFGVTPAVLLFLPFRLLTGRFIDDGLAVPLFACAGLGLSFLLLRAMRARYFRTTSSLALAACTLALGLANLVPMLLRRTSVWEIPIACGFFCCMGSLYALFQAWHSPRRVGWLAAASGGLGLAVGSRPTYLLGCSALAITLWALLRAEAGAGASRRFRLVLAALLPIAAVGAGLALYNYLRFDNPLDFGFRHLMNSEQAATERIFSWPFLRYNLRVYALAPATWTPFFPFVALAHLPPPPPGYLAVEDPYGILPNIPFVMFAGGLLSLAALRVREDRARLGIFCAAVLAVALGTGLMTASFGGAINRYMVDFLPALIVLACIGFLALIAQPWCRGWLGILIGAGSAGLLGYSIFFNVMASIRHNELFRAEHPAIYERVAHFGNFPSALFDRWHPASYGTVELKVIFPSNKIGQIEPLVVTGSDFLSDYLYVHYLAADSVRFGLVHTSTATLLGPPMKIVPGAVQTLRIDLGSLYPPAGHPYFDAMPAGEARLRQETVRVICNGQVAFERRTPFYDAVAHEPVIGSSGGRPGFTQPFSGKIVSSRRIPLAPLAALAGPLRLELILPPFQGQVSEPLLSTGDPGRGDLFYVRYVGPGRIALGYDHWGEGGQVSSPIAVDYAAVQVVEIDSGSLHPGAGDKAAGTGPLRLRLNGRTVFELSASFYPYEPYTVIVGMNAIGASTALTLFSGNIVSIGPGPGLSAPAR